MVEFTAGVIGVVRMVGAQYVVGKGFPGIEIEEALRLLFHRNNSNHLFHQSYAFSRQVDIFLTS